MYKQIRKFNIIVAFDLNRGIGLNNTITWNYHEDLKQFKALTLNQTVIMGAKTFYSIYNKIKKPLQNRKNIILSKQNKTNIKNILNNHDIEYTIYDNINELIQNEQQGWVIGGNEIYKLLLPHSKQIYATEINKTFQADTFFPEINLNEWKQSINRTNNELTFKTFQHNELTLTVDS
jgi:dihydrofolate reductase